MGEMLDSPRVRVCGVAVIGCIGRSRALNVRVPSGPFLVSRTGAVG